ncbi:type III pantothenate kinase [Pontivivens insulae]|uniref:Type III pantothenate kinase n=1 Tax=Pontivivens insulae TaxID=1639689 RepID=A0A2R8AC51_9RHOB|nr:type III pantothenate kinase [Pontivivens insulae]RED13779.1 type III pantothenate kinase [Pontivivens insulae]SPF29853.1 Type III pantothenate kinase [Pontivivens insulae]
MLLAIDVGNTNTVFALHDGSKFIGEWRCSTYAQRTADQYYVWLRQLVEFNELPFDVDQVVISSVVPQVVFNLRLLSDRYFDCRPLVVGKPDCALPVAVRVDEGTLVGADRLVNTVAGFDRFGGDLIVLDFGTATTFDVVDSDGAYIGGVIAPGVNLSVKALHEAAAALPNIDVTKPQQVVGTNTVACMQSGVFWGYVGLIEGICKQIKAERDRPMKVIATGGLSTLFNQGTDEIDTIDTELTMHGLVLIHEYNRKQV